MHALSHPYSGIVNHDPLSAAWLRKIAATDEQPIAAVNSVLPKPLAVFVADSKGTPVLGASIKFKIISGGGMLQCLNAAGGNEGPLSETDCTTTSGANGIAQAKLTLGKSTDANPQYMMLDPGDEFSTQIGVNLVTATASGYSGELQLDQPFAQYGKPEVPQKIKKLNGDGVAWYVNNPVGSLRVKVLDQYDNVVSNATVIFSAQTAESIDPLVTLPTDEQGFRNIEFYKSEECNLPDPEGHIAYPLYGDCDTYYGGQTGISVKTEYFGATVNAVLGNTVNTRYKVKVTAQGIQAPEEFTLTSYGSRENADGYIAPSLQITYFELYNDRGELVNAAKTGTELKAPLTAALALYSDETTTEGPYQCTINNQQTNCWKIKPTGIIKTKKITNGTVTFTPKDGNGLVTATTITNGQYQTRYTTGVTPAKNTIEAFGEAEVSVPEVFYDTANNCSASRTEVPVDKVVTIKSGQVIAFEKDSGAAHTGICGVDPATHQTACVYDTGQYEKVTYTVFGVNAALIIEPEIVLLNDESYSTVDTTFKYTILPPEYSAIIADVDIYKINANNVDEWINYIPGDKTKGQGAAGFVQGTKFDINAHYKAQVLLNRGTDIEITSRTEINNDNIGNDNSICDKDEACVDKVPLLLIAADLDIDSDNNSESQINGIQADPARSEKEDDMEDRGNGTGKVLRFNNGDKDHDRVPDFADGIDLYDNQGSNASEAFAPMILEIKGDTNGPVRIRFTYAESDPSAITRTGNSTDGYTYTPGPGNVRLWTKNGPENRRVASVKNGGDYIKAGEAYTFSDLGISSNNKIIRLFVEGIAASTSPGDQRILVEIDPDGNGPQGYMAADAVRVTMDTLLVPDYNHDRTIDDKDRERASNHDIYYFWVNDDNDTGETGGSDIPGDTSLIDAPECFGSGIMNPVAGCDNFGNASSMNVNGVRDLVDFFPVYLDIKGLFDIFDPNLYTYKLKSEDSSLRFAFTDLKPETAGEYLTGSADSLEPATTLGHAATYMITKEGVAFKDLDDGPAFLQKIKDEGKGIILLEGRKASDKPLVLAIYDNSNDTEVFSTSLKLSLAGVEKMFRHKNLISAGVITDGTTGENTADAVPAPGHGSVRGGEPDRLGEPAKFPDSECNQENFVLLHGLNVNGQQARGWHAEIFKRMYWSGSRAKFWGVSWYGFRTQILQWQTPDFHINVRHAFNTATGLATFLNSIGNVTVAAHSLGNMVVSSAINDHGANVKHYFMLNAALPTEAFYGQEGTNGALTPAEWTGYREGLRATEWYKLFINPGDYRAQLTWRNRFTDGPLTVFTNFYSPGDEVVSTWWQFQELLKGTVGVLGYNGADYGGWGFNLQDEGYYIEEWDEQQGKMVRKPRPYAEANSFPDSALMTKPFFKRGGLIEPLLVAGGSDFAKTNRNRMLSESFPALTLAVGMNYVFNLQDSNLDMQNKFKTMKNDIVQWPRIDDVRWKHSDFKDVAYLYLYNIYFKIVSSGGLSQ